MVVSSGRGLVHPALENIEVVNYEDRSLTTFLFVFCFDFREKARLFHLYVYRNGGSAQNLLIFRYFSHKRAAGRSQHSRLNRNT